MPELSNHHKRDIGDALLDLDESLLAGLTVPSLDSPDVQALLTEIGADTPLRIALREDHLGLYRWPEDGVRARMDADGGAIRLGWRLFEWPGMLLIAEYHAVWQEPDGTLVDITPAPIEDSNTLFAPDDRVPPVSTRYRTLHVSPDRSQAIADRIDGLKGGQRAYEEKRAAKAGQSLIDWIAGRHFTDPLIEAIPAFTAACDVFTAKLARLPDLIELRPDDYDDVAEGQWHPDWETETARDKLIDWDIAREEQMMGIEAGMRVLGLADTRVFDDAPEEN